MAVATQSLKKYMFCKDRCSSDLQAVRPDGLNRSHPKWQ